MQIVTSDDNRPLHFHLFDDSFQNPAPDSHITSERALLIDVRAVHSLQSVALDWYCAITMKQTHLFRRFESQTHVIHASHLFHLFDVTDHLFVEEYSQLLLESSLILMLDGRGHGDDGEETRNWPVKRVTRDPQSGNRKRDVFPVSC